MPSPFTCSPVICEWLRKKIQIEKKPNKQKKEQQKEKAALKLLLGKKQFLNVFRFRIFPFPSRKLKRQSNVEQKLWTNESSVFKWENTCYKLRVAGYELLVVSYYSRVTTYIS